MTSVDTETDQSEDERGGFTGELHHQRGDQELHAGARPGEVHHQEREDVHLHEDTQVHDIPILV